MRKLNHLRLKWQIVVFWLIAILIVVADQLTKLWIRSNLALGQSLAGTEFPRIVRIENDGAAFGSFQGHSLAFIIAAFAAIVILLCYVFFLHRRFPYFDTMLGKFTLGLVLGGIIGNLIDRLRFNGYVTDFIDFGFWAAFNIADSAVTIGVILLVIVLLLLARSMEAGK